MRRFAFLALVLPHLLFSLPLLGAEDASTVEATPRPMNVDDALDMVRVGRPLMSPDGTWVLFEETTLDWDKNKRKTKVYRVSADGEDRWQFLTEEKASAFQFSPDGRYLAFLRQAKGDGSTGGDSGGKAGNENQTQIFALRTAGGEATQLTKHDTSVRSFRWSADSKRIVFSALDKRPKDEDKRLKAGADVVFVNEGPNGQDADYWSNLWSFDLASEESTRLTEEPFIVGDFDLSPDGARVALTARYRNRRNDADRTEIFVLDRATRTKKRLTENAAPEHGALWSPDSRHFVYMAADDEHWLNRNDKIWLMDADQGVSRLLSGAFEGNISDVTWAPDGASILFVGQQGTRSNLFRLTVASGEVEPLTQVTGWLRAASFSADRTRVAYAFSDPQTPEDLYAGRLDGAATPANDDRQPHGPRLTVQRLTEANPNVAGLQLASSRVIRWTSHDGLEIEGLLHLPVGYQEGTQYPLMLNIHGGPAGSFSNSWRSHYHVYAGLGYVSLSPNVRGSDGYTDALREGNTVAQNDGIGLGDFQDLMTGVDALIAQGIVDPDRLALRGWSYGGILGGWTITQTDRFKAASIGAGVYDWTSEYGPGFNNDVRLWHIGGTPWDNPEGYRNQSALTHVANVTTPTILFHGDADTVDTEQQSMMMFTALQDIGKAPVRYIKFPRQPHGIREPRHIRILDVEEIRWMQEHVLDQEWTPPVREEKKDEDEEKEEGREGEAEEDESED